MSDSKRADIASFNITFNMPPEVITAYYEGMAKVELAKHGHAPVPMPASKAGSMDWISSLSWLVPMVMPLISDKLSGSLLGLGSGSSGSGSSGSGSGSSSSSGPRVPRSKKSKASIKPEPTGEQIDKIINSMSKDEREQFQKEVTKEVTNDLGPLSKSEESMLTALLNPAAQVTPNEEDKKEVVASPSEEKETEPVKLNFDFGGSAGGGFAEMMKMLGPMVKELTGAFEAPKAAKAEPAESVPAETTSETSDPIADKIIEKVPFDE